MSDFKLDTHLLDQLFTKLEASRTWSPRVISKLENVIVTSDDFGLFRINPIHFAAEKDISETEAIDLFLHGTKIGLFEMEWHLICAYCASVVESFRDLTNVFTHFGCKVCSTVNDVALDDYIQVSFTISEQVRDIKFRHPELLSTEDFYLKYYLSKDVALLPNGQKYQDLLMDLTKIFVDLDPAQKEDFEFDLKPGLFQIRDLVNNTSATYFIGENKTNTPAKISLKLEDGKFQSVKDNLVPQEIFIEPCTIQLEAVGESTAGNVHIEIENLMTTKSPVWMILYPPDYKPSYKELSPFLSGKRLLTSQTFRTLFRTEHGEGTEGLGVKDITFLFTDLKGSTDMYDRIGDLKAYSLVSQHFVALEKVIARNSGAVVKTIGDAVMATFMNPLDALKTAVDMLNDIGDLNQNLSDNLILKIGIHRGPSIVVTLNNHLDYFGQTVNIAARVQGLAGANEIYMSSDARSYPGVELLLNELDVSTEDVSLRGVHKRLEVSKIVV